MFYTILVISAAVVTDVVQSQCTPLTSCSCRSPQGVVDLSPLVQHFGQSPRFKDVASSGPGQQNYVYSYNPCFSFTEADTTGTQICNNVAICQLTRTMDKSYSLGTQSSAEFVTVPGSGLTIVYKATSVLHNIRVSHVSLVCDPNTEASFTALGELPSGSMQYYFKLTSKYACPVPDTTTTPAPPPPPSTATPAIWTIETMTIIEGGILLCVIVLVVMAVLIYKKKKPAAVSFAPPDYDSHVYPVKKIIP
ncbi:uncharacterized protein LOC121380815 [Gigantopelta aegis]|uniref:uncharacterized protein LOC121380815 n=1 Tax=Gigantopelta aegis TaxID=1735272 RepID=UPI001B88990C|nr:uncharacterized protein LOC121380815 [Gigantopelta aegis]